MNECKYEDLFPMAGFQFKNETTLMVVRSMKVWRLSSRFVAHPPYLTGRF